MPKAGSAAAKTRAPARWRMGTAPDDGSSAAAASIVTRAASRSAKDAAVARTLLVALRERRSAIEQAFYEMGKLLVKLKAPKMWAALGYTGFDAMIEGEDVVERTTAYELIEIVQAYPAKLAVAAGRTKATAVLRACGGDAVKARKALESGTLYGRSLDGLAAKRILGLRAAARAATAARKSPALRAAKD
ncbi:MAG: hypothetical protein IT379_25825, partial [Deltaproteobacteria bacterium]|nr:hypothetical protein [Deltaproteobacteria bacterium]